MSDPRPIAEEKPARKPRATPGGKVLSRIFPLLSFDEPLESHFQRWYSEQIRARIRNTMWIPMASLLVLSLASGPFTALRDALFGTDNKAIVDILRLGLITPSCIAMLLITYTERYARWFALTAQIVAPIHAMCFVAMDLLMHRQGYSLSSLMPLVVLGPYFLFGMLQAQAVRTVIMIVATYALGGYFAGLTGGQRAFDLTVVVFAGSLGTAIHYSLHYMEIGRASCRERV